MAALGRNAANELSGKIAAELARRSTVIVTVRGLSSINRLSEVKDALLKTSGVGDLYMRSFSEGTAEMEIKINSATSADLANTLTRNAALNAKVVGQTQDSLEVEAQ